MIMDNSKKLITIGRTTTIDLFDEGAKNIPAKVDTGADSSSIWASELEMSQDGVLSYVFFAKGSQYYSGKRHESSQYEVRRVWSSHGVPQVRYRVKMTIVVEGRRIRGTFTLADRSQNNYPVLLGCRLLNGKFLVDVSKGFKMKRQEISAKQLTLEAKQDPVVFFKKYYKSNNREEVE